MWSYRLTGPTQFVSEDIADLDAAAVGEGEVLLKTLAGGVCGSDLPLYRGVISKGTANFLDPEGHPVSGAPMHEIVGEVVVSRSDRFPVGSQVVGWATKFNALAEYTVTDSEAIHEYGDWLTPTEAIMLQPLACVLYAMGRLPVAGNHVAVLGLGPIGTLFSHVARDLGAKTVTGVDPVDRRDVAQIFGIDRPIVATSAAWAASVDDADRPQLVIEAVGHQEGTLQDAIAGVAFGGGVFYFGVPDNENYVFPMATFFNQNLTFSSGWTMDRSQMLAQAEAYLKRYPELPASYITDKFDRDDIQRAFETAARARQGRLKVVVRHSS